jgi:hypothetical protein
MTPPRKTKLAFGTAAAKCEDKTAMRGLGWRLRHRRAWQKHHGAWGADFFKT